MFCKITLYSFSFLIIKSQFRWSTSAQDLFNFIESTLDLKTLILPGTSRIEIIFFLNFYLDFVRGYVQCCVGLVQNFVFIMTSIFPDPSDLIPELKNLPVIAKEEKKTSGVLNLKILNKKSKNQNQVNQEEKIEKKISKDHKNLTFQTVRNEIQLSKKNQKKRHIYV